MTPTPPSTNPDSTGAGRSPEEQFRIVRRRNRVPLSCDACRKKKLKCDRNQPCGNCIKRKGMDTSECSYAAPVSRKKSQRHEEDSLDDDMQNRIDRLEGLVLSFMHNGANIDTGRPHPRNSLSTSQSITDSVSSAARQPRGEEAVMADDDESDVDHHLAESLGFLKVDAEKGKSMYIGQENWHLILSDIAEVKNFFISHKKEFESSCEKMRSSKPATAREGPTLLLGAVPASETELRSGLPHRSNVLILCNRYFSSMDNAVSIIHGPTFWQQLRDHWQAPSETPVMWLGLLYAMLCIAMQSIHKVGDEPPEWRGRTLDLAAEYRLRTVQCLLKADYTKPVEYTVETMLLYICGEYSSRWDADLGLWMIASLTIRIAFRMGYHRDAKWFPSLTPFQAEMRRRTWALVRMADVVFSHQVSLPNMIYDHDCDTRLPNNIYDDDFDRDSKELPPSRPVTEATPVSYMIAKARLCIELGRILQATNRVDKGVPYDDIIRFDAKVRQIMQELPPHLRLGSLAGSQDPVTLTLARFNIDILSQKIMCLLHRKYLGRARQNPRYAHSRRSAVGASLRALEHLQTLHRESQGGGLLRSMSWYVKSIATREFILPAMLIVLDLHYDNLASQSGPSDESEGAFRWPPEQRAKMIGSLEEAATIWNSLAEGSMDAYKGAKTVEIMLQKLKEPAGRRADKMTTDSSILQPEMRSSLANGAVLDPTMSAAGPRTTSSDGFTDVSTGFLGPLSGTNSSTFMTTDLNFAATTLDEFPFDGRVNPFGPQSPMSMCTDLGGVSASASGPDLSSSNFDWGAFETYTQQANWGADQSFQVFGGGDADDEENGMMNTQ